MVFLGWLSGCADRPPEVSNRKTAVKVVSIPVKGMSCAACAARIRRTLGSLKGVSEVEVSLGERLARVHLEPDGPSSERLRAAIEGVGYEAGSPVEAP
jgi:P-type Cu+ transporter